MSPSVGMVFFDRSGSARAERTGQDEQDGQDFKIEVRRRGARGPDLHRRRQRHGLFRAVAIVIVALGHAPTSRGQCSFDWRPGHGPPGVNGDVWAMTTWDPDGLERPQELFVVGGDISSVEDLPVNNIAAWDGTSWHALGSGVNDLVLALCVYDGALIASGQFTEAGGTIARGVARWDGTKWEPLGAGLDGWVFRLCVYNDRLIAGGYFTSLGGSTATNIAQWDGENWQPLGDGLGGPDPAVGALAVYDGKLIVGGSFATAGGARANNIAQWDGVSWEPLGDGISEGGDGSYILVLQEYEGKLIAGGASFHAVLQWDGTTWEPLENGIASYSEIFTLNVFRGKLIAAGMVYAMDDPHANHIVQWNGERWESLPGDFSWYIYSSGVYHDDLIAGDWGIQRFDGTTWRPIGLGFDYDVRRLTVFNGELIAGGPFRYVAGVRANGIAAWNGATWRALGNGVFECPDSGIARKPCPGMSMSALAVYEGHLFVGGSFKLPGEDETTIVAQWDGTTWEPLCRGAPEIYPGVSAMTVFDGDLIVGGNFVTAGDITVNRVASWNGSTWQSLGGGMNDNVWDLVVYDDKLIAAGAFTSAGGIYVPKIAQWDGKSWEPFSTGLRGTVGRLEVFDHKVVAGGLFEIDSGVYEYRVAEWNGTSWQRLGGAMNDSIYTLVVLGGKLIAGGNFTRIGDTTVYRIAQWDGVAWSSFGIGLNRGLGDLVMFNGELIAGGGFGSAGGNISSYFARWGPSCLPGDMNCDGVIDKVDLMPFVDALLEPEGESDCVRYLANMNGDVEADGASKVDGADVGPFVAAMMGW